MDEEKNEKNDAARNAKVNFDLGKILLTPDAVIAFEECGESLWKYVERHHSGDWGHVSKRDKKENKLALKKGFRIVSVYKLPNTGEKIWIITEADRSATTILLPSEY